MTKEECVALLYRLQGIEETTKGGRDHGALLLQPSRYGGWLDF